VAISQATGFRVYDSESTLLSAEKSIAQYMATWWGVDFGCTWEANMYAGASYAAACGISCTAPMVDSRLNAWYMFDQVYAAILGDRPCIIAIWVDSSGNGASGVAPNHYVVVEEASKTNYRTSFAGLFWWPWANGSVTFKANMGWGVNTAWGHRYINIIDNDPVYTAPGNLTSCFDVWDIRM
jgi:hypothetical protein